MRALCTPEVFKKDLGCTSLITHDIVVEEDAPIKRMSYRILEHLLGPLKKEIELMLLLGIIEASQSEWCNPIVRVPRKDGTIRFFI